VSYNCNNLYLNNDFSLLLIIIRHIKIYYSLIEMTPNDRITIKINYKSKYYIYISICITIMVIMYDDRSLPEILVITITSRETPSYGIESIYGRAYGYFIHT